MKKKLAEINAAIHDGMTPPIACIDGFLELVTDRSMFESIFAQLDPKLQAHVTRYAKVCCAPIFDDLLVSCQAEAPPEVFEAWLAFKEWSERQPWWAEAKKAPRPIIWTEEQTAAFLDAERAKATLDMARHFARGSKTKEDGLMWKQTIAELQKNSDDLAAHVDATVPRRKR